jgi:hypothetical protein
MISKGILFMSNYKNKNTALFLKNWKCARKSYYKRKVFKMTNAGCGSGRDIGDIPETHVARRSV